MVLYYKPIYLTDASAGAGTCTARSFSTMFAFKATNALGLDGFTFLLSSLPVMGAASLGLGYALTSYTSSDLPTFHGSLSVEFDVIANGRVADMNRNHIGVNVASFINGSQAAQSTHSLAAVDATLYAVRLLQSKLQRRAWVTYDGASKVTVCWVTVRFWTLHGCLGSPAVAEDMKGSQRNHACCGRFMAVRCIGTMLSYPCAEH